MDGILMNIQLPAIARNTILCSVFAACLPTPASADPISTDRPDFVESSLTVGTGTFQIETSVAMERRDGVDDRPQTLATPTLLRLGFSENWEARLETDGLLLQRSDASTPQADGIGDIALGVKYHVPSPGPADASLAVLFHVDLPSGSRAFRASGVGTSLRGVAEWELPHDCSLGLMPGLALNEDDAGNRYVSGIFGITVAHAWTPQFRSFVELASEELGSAGHGDTQFSFDTGLVWLINDNLQLDTAAYAGLNRSTPDITLAIGLSARW